MVNGHRKEKDFESRERFAIMRKLMWSTLVVAPGMKKGFQEKDVIIFPWESNMIKTITLEENAQLESEIEKVKAFYARVDGKKNEA